MTTIVPPIMLRISGVQTLEVAKFVAKNGFGIAFNFDCKNPKFIEPSKANQIKQNISKETYTCGIFKDPTDQEITKCLNEIDINQIQLNGNENKDRVQFIKLWFSKYPLKAQLNPGQNFPTIYKKERKYEREIIKSVTISCKKDIEKISNYKDIGVSFLLDTSEEENIDWNIFSFNDTPGIISGKFNKENIKSAINKKKYFIDISKGLENKMNELSIEKIKSLFEFIRSDEIESARF